MLTRLSLRVRVFLIFAGLAAVVLAALLGGLYLAGAGLDAAAQDRLVQAGLIGGFGALGAITLVWYLFDINVARPIETLAGGILTGAMPGPDEGRYLADLAPAARRAAEARAKARAELDAAMEAHAAAQAREKGMLESILSDLGAGAIMTDAEGRVVFYNNAAGQLLPGLTLDRMLARFVRPGGLDAALARIRAGAGGTDVTLIGDQDTRLTGRMRRLEGEAGGFVLILRPVGRDTVAPRAAMEKLRRHASTLVPLLGDMSGPVPPALGEAIRAEGQGLSSALRELDAVLTARPPRQRRVSADELARGLGLPLGEVAGVTLAADGWQIGGLLAMIAARLIETGREPTASITAGGDEALVTLSWQGAPLSIAKLDQWLGGAPDPDQPDLSGHDILALHGSGIWPEGGNGGEPRLALPLTISAQPVAARPGVTYDFALSGKGAGDLRPLGAMSCVVFDTETTGLTMADKIVQIAGLRISNGRLTGESYETLVDPGRRIPPGSTVIHGITDEMVKGAPAISEALRGFARFAEDAVLIAHNAPFDIGLLRAAENETGVRFRNKVMDTVLLSAMIWGQGAVHSLDAICERLEIDLPPELRHTAMGDARATAEAYLRMLPALAAKGVTKFEHVLAETRKYRRLLADANLPGVVTQAPPDPDLEAEAR
ncbi:MAG: exonuclease domain-containing protein [Paracoccus sp. (in: a-proteobacteria)]|nr:exonuclease domain-containing protein [Paracoccus sp. (in: a-proteobacteria)]